MGIKHKIGDGIRKLSRALNEKEMVPVTQYVDKDNILAGKVALITGGSGGIGSAMARLFVKSGAKVIIAGTNETKLKKVASELVGDGNNSVRWLVINVLKVETLSDCVEKAALLFPDNRIDILVNSAGVLAHRSFLEMNEGEYDKIMDINTKGTFFMSQAVARYMIKKKIKGHILNVTSSSALRPAWTPYQMSKWAVRGFTEGLADTLLPYGITVNAIAPGPTATEMLNVKKDDNIYNSDAVAGRYALPEEISQLAVFMVSDAGNMIVGDTFYITGGSGVISYHK